MKHLSYLNKYFWKYKYRLALGIVFIIVSNFFLILPAQVIRHAFNLVEETIDLYFMYEGFDSQSQIYKIFIKSIFVYGATILIMALLRGLFLFLVRQTIIIVSRYIEFDLKNEIYAHYQTLPFSFYRKNNTGDLMARISEDVSHVRMYLGPAIMYGINLCVLFCMIIPYMYNVSERLTLFALLPLPFLSISIYLVNNRINRRSEAIQKSLSRLSTFVQEAFSGIRVLKAFVREKDSYDDFEKESEAYRSKYLSLVRVEALFFPLIMTLIGLSNIIVIYIGGQEVIEGSLSKGNIAEFILYLNMLVWPVTSLGWITSIIQRAAASQKRINEFLYTKTDIISTKNLQKELDGHISFDNVSIKYPDTGIMGLDGLSFEIKAGESVAILGTTGSGKSTLANLILRLYDATEGQVMIDGIDIQDFELTNLRDQIAYVPQDVFLFSDTIRNNISFGGDNFSEDQIVEVAKRADVYTNIMDFPNQFDTAVGERGIALSGGQKQRISIARALIKNPKVLILDDSLSAVDTKTENAILNSLEELMGDRTTIIISHRVSSVKMADQILVLDEGKILQRGTHDELLAKDGFYKDLYKKQIQQDD